ncbi:hypothetical protein FHG64_08680 [Antarcticibacterium flavum]|uniref:Uncharacterized protein n=1 Tax=Antarcticibacterium flavum TaxID=2058175 RepID=A0A5B7X430_9FLAO|nr:MULTISPECIES: hypothetical protein [Antarcticibacterium]MCM4159055.1 hypothetical protein [Antarcticibacterium sp. W02-3]QCY69458.1 hypothetical protein FHG64_08680 [Antarcticibacterium flavum]
MQIRKIGLGILAICVMGFTSCKDEEKATATPPQSEVQTNQNPKTTAAVNPAHGQPGHRCDIPVGAPLDQASGTQAMQQQQQSQTINSPTSSPVRVNNSTATPTKNPPHGQPGHDCTIPVGADLTSN